MLTTQANGNIVSEPKLVTIKDDFKIVETRLAVQKTKDKVIFIDLKFKNNKAGEIFLQYAKKGSNVSVWGQLDEEVWGDGDKKRSKFVIEADGFRFGSAPKQDGDKPVGTAKPKSAPQTQEESTEDIPF